MEIIRIPVERVGPLLGRDGEAKARLEHLTGARISVDSDGEVTVEGDSAQEFFLKDVIKAVGRGFDPVSAEKLLSEKYSLEIIDLKDICKGDKDLQRVRGRIIGEEGKMKAEIEAALECRLSIYGWTVGVIAPLDTMVYAHKALNRIIEGAQLTTVFNDLARYRKEIMANRLMGK